MTLRAPRNSILGLYYRSLGFCRAAIELKSVIHQQSLTSAERSVSELYVDMELVHRNAIDDGIEKFNVFMDYCDARPSSAGFWRLHNGVIRIPVALRDGHPRIN